MAALAQCMYNRHDAQLTPRNLQQRETWKYKAVPKAVLDTIDSTQLSNGTYSWLGSKHKA